MKIGEPLLYNDFPIDSLVNRFRFINIDSGINITIYDAIINLCAINTMIVIHKLIYEDRQKN